MWRVDTLEWRGIAHSAYSKHSFTAIAFAFSGVRLRRHFFCSPNDERAFVSSAFRHAANAMRDVHAGNFISLWCRRQFSLSPLWAWKFHFPLSISSPPRCVGFFGAGTTARHCESARSFSLETGNVVRVYKLMGSLQMGGLLHMLREQQSSQAAIWRAAVVALIMRASYNGCL
jgi:hypothetical protein